MIKDKIIELISEADEIKKLSLNFIHSAPIEYRQLSDNFIGASNYCWRTLDESMHNSQNELLSKYEKWYAASKRLVNEVSPDRSESFNETYDIVRKWLSLYYGPGTKDRNKIFQEIWQHFKSQIDIVSSLQGVVEVNEIIEAVDKCEDLDETSVYQIMRILERFHKIARQLRSRYDERPTLEIEDEYDVQDLLHALLKLYFNDVRAEEWTPSYAGGSSRMDFLLKDEEIVIEVKKTRQTLKDKAIGEQLIIDIGKYAAHPGCKTLICFVYDPAGRIGNPKGLENDLNQMSKDGLQVITKIEPDA